MKQRISFSSKKSKEEEKRKKKEEERREGEELMQSRVNWTRHDKRWIAVVDMPPPSLLLLGRKGK